VAAFHPAVDPTLLLGSAVQDALLGRFVLTGAGLVVMAGGFLLVARAPQPHAVEAKAPKATGPTPARAAPQPVAARGPVAAAPAAPQADDPVSAVERDIKALNRRINMARVELGMGRLSPAGYTAYVRNLEAERARLEKVRFAAQLRQGAPVPVGKNVKPQ